MDVKTEIYRLKEKLSSCKESKVEASLQRLKKLPIDLDLLLETGIGKAVNKLRHHEKFGDIAKNLVAKWKQNAYENAQQNGIELTETTTDSVPKNGRVRNELEQKCVKIDNLSSKNSNHIEKSLKPELLDRHKDAPSSSVSTNKRMHDDKIKPKTKKKTEKLDNDEDGFTSFEAALGSLDKVSKPKIASKPTKVIKNDEKDDGERRNSFEEIDWSKVLPKTIPDYRPQHLPPDMYDSDNCTSANINKKRAAGFGEYEDANLFSSKKDRNKVFSGRRTVFLNKIHSLFDSCIRVLCDNIDSLGYTGGVPYDILKPVLERATPAQLFRIEDCNPYLVEDTDFLWETLAKKDFRDPEREELESWREVYERLLEERERKLQIIKSKVTASKTANGPVRQSMLAVAKAPRDVRRQQIKYGTGRREIPSAEELVASRRNIEAHPEDRTKIICRPSSSQHESEMANRKRKPRVAPLMAKTLKMLKIARR